jgi:CHASE3 domain sensor protein
MAIRTKLYAAMVVAVMGLTLLAGLGFWGMSQLSDHFTAARTAADDRALALELKYDITDLNGWQTAYGYDNGASRPIFLKSVDRFRGDLALARRRLTSPAEQKLLSRTQHGFDDFMQLDAEAFAAVQSRHYNVVRNIFLGPEIRNFQRIADAADELATLEASRSSNENRQFSDARTSNLRLMVIAALLAAAFVAILLVTANDLARAAEQAIPAADDEPEFPSP